MAAINSRISQFYAYGITLLVIPALFAGSVKAQIRTTGELNLNECIEIGLQNNPKFQSSGFTVEGSKAKIDEAFSAYYPTINANSSADAYSKNNGTQRYDNFSSGVTLSYDIFRGYRTKSSYEASKENYNSSVYQHETNRQDLVFNIIQAYYRSLQLERIVKSAEEAVKNSFLHLEFAKAKQKAGMATRSDVLKSEVELSNAELNKIQAANSLLSVKGILNQLMGFPSDSLVKLTDDLSIVDELPVQPFDTLLNMALNSRSEIKKYQSLLSAQQNYIQVAKSGFYPSLSANANYNYAGPELSSMQNNWWLGMTLSIPVFKGFLNKSRVNQEESAFRSLEKDNEQMKQQIGQEVWDAWLSVKESADRISTSMKATDSAKENLSLAEGEYKEGVGSIIQLTDAQTTFVSAEQNYIQALADYKISTAQLKRTLGR